MADPILIKTANDSETWQITESGRTRYVKIAFDHDLDAVIVSHADHKGSWVSVGERFDSFEEARTANGLPAQL